MSLFKPARNESAFLKLGLMGAAGSGKTYTASRIARGVVELAREVRRVEGNYPAKALTGAVRERKLAALMAALRTLQTVERHADGLRTLLAYLIRADGELPSRTEAEILREQPTVAALLAAFPGADIVGVTIPATPSADQFESADDAGD